MHTWKKNLSKDILSLKGNDSIELKLFFSDEFHHSEKDDFVEIVFNDFVSVKIYDRKDNNILHKINETKHKRSINYNKYRKVFQFLEENEKELNNIYNNIFTN